MTDKTPSESKTLVNLKTKKPPPQAAPPVTPHDHGPAANTSQHQDDTAQESTNESGGAAEAAGVLTAVDEDVEGGEEAELPHEFDYHSDAYDEEG